MPEQMQILKLDDIVIEQKTAHYPEEAQEPARWLAGFVRENCNKQIAPLVERLKKIGHKTDYSLWHRILTGKYFQKDDAGKITGSVNNFIQIVDALRAQARIEWRAGRPPFIETPTFHLITDYIDKKRQPERANKFGSIIGYTGTQKSASFKEYRSRNNHGKVVHVESPERASMNQFLTDLARQYVGYNLTRGNDKRARITANVNEHKCIIVDNVQRLYAEDAGANQTIFSFLQKLQDDTDCTIIMSYTPEFADVLTRGAGRGYFEQFIGRMGGLRKALVLPDFATRDDVLAIAAGFDLKEAKSNVKYLEAISREPGRIRALFDDLQDAAQLAKADKKPLTIDYVRMVRSEEESEGK